MYCSYKWQLVTNTDCLYGMARLTSNCLIISCQYRKFLMIRGVKISWFRLFKTLRYDYVKNPTNRRHIIQIHTSKKARPVFLWPWKPHCQCIACGGVTQLHDCRHWTLTYLATFPLLAIPRPIAPRFRAHQAKYKWVTFGPNNENHQLGIFMWISLCVRCFDFLELLP